MSEHAVDQKERRSDRLFRGVIGMLCLIGAFSGLFALYLVEVPTGNREPLLLALGIVLGWGSSVVSSEYGSTATGRKAADSVFNKLSDPVQEVSVVNTLSDPVPTTTPMTSPAEELPEYAR